MLKRSSTHILKYQTLNKTNYLKSLFIDFEYDLNFYINKIITGEIDLKKFCSTNLEGKIKHSRWKQIILKNASEIIRSQIDKANKKRYKQYKKLYAKCIKANKHKSFTDKRFSELNLKNILKSKYFTKPNLKNITLTIDNRVINFQNSNHFDEFAQITLPYFYETKKRALKIRLPIKHHKHSNKFKDWSRCPSVRLRKINNQFYLDFIYEKEAPIKKTKGDLIGIDQGYKKLLSCSNGKFYGNDLFNIYQKISNKLRGSKNYNQNVHYKKTEINRIINEFFKNNKNLSYIFMEDLKEVKKSSKIYHKTMNKMQYWTYGQVLNKFEELCEMNGVHLIKINPAYTSQTCSNCGTVDKNSRNREIYSCQHCRYEIDADTNAAINIYNRGVYSLSGTKID